MEAAEDIAIRIIGGFRAVAKGLVICVALACGGTVGLAQGQQEEAAERAAARSGQSGAEGPAKPKAAWVGTPQTCSDG